MTNKLKGYNAEEKATVYLKAAGYKILERNYNTRGGEIDIIAKDGNELVFVEVKSLADEKVKQLAETISAHKQQALIKTCRKWIWKQEFDEINWRIDFIGLIVDSRGRIKKLQHLKNAIY